MSAQSRRALEIRPMNDINMIDRRFSASCLLPVRTGVTARVQSPKVGMAVALSGGGITGILGGLCTLNALSSSVFQSLNVEPKFSTVSGGTVGYGAWVNSKPLYYHTLNHNTTYEDETSEDGGGDSETWFAEIIHYLNWVAPDAQSRSMQDTSETENSSPLEDIQSGWWTNVIDLAYWEGYGVHDYDVKGGENTWYANFVLAKKNQCPVSTISTGVFKEAQDILVYANMDMTTGEVRAADGGSLKLKHDDPLDAISYSSSFWTAAILESSTTYFFLHLSIPTGTLDGDTVYLNDGGLIDTTGIVTHLQNKEPVVIAFYNNNDPLSTLDSPFRFLFGVEGDTDTMNSVSGPDNNAVFPSDLWPSVISNLTDSSIQRARLTDVQVSTNSFLGVSSYTLSELIIIANERDEDFLNLFQDDRIQAEIDDRWPNDFPVSMPTLDANILCQFADYKVSKYADEITEALSEGNTQF